MSTIKFALKKYFWDHFVINFNTEQPRVPSRLPMLQLLQASPANYVISHH